jgi:hypothetical protein
MILKTTSLVALAATVSLLASGCGYTDLLGKDVPSAQTLTLGDKTASNVDSNLVPDRLDTVANGTGKVSGTSTIQTQAETLTTATTLQTSTAVATLATKQLSAKTATNDCTLKDIGYEAGRSDGHRNQFSFVTLQEAEPGSTVTTNCVKLVGLEAPMTMQMHRGSPISVNGGPFVAGVSIIKDGDEVRVRSVASSIPDERVDEYAQFDGKEFWGTMIVRTKNADRPPKVFQVGPNRAYKQITEVTQQLRAGDLVEVDSGIYDPIDLRRSGSIDLPITIRGVGSTRPQIVGGNWTVSFRYADNVVLENFEVSGGTSVCVRTMGNNIVVRNVFIHDCIRHGVLGADKGNGNNVFDRVEIARSGSIIPGEAYNHALYVATDRDAFPGSILRVQHSYLHDNKGNSIKSRSTNAEIYFNWIDTQNNPDAFYSIELVGYQEYAVDQSLNADVVGNVLVHRGAYGMRFGGDGTGASKGRVRLANNSIVASKQFGEWGGFFRLDQELDSLYLLNNAFVMEEGTSAPLRLFRNGLDKWTSGIMKVAGAGNLFPNGTYMDIATSLKDLALPGSIYKGALVNSSNLGVLDLTPLSGSALMSGALPMTTSAAGFETATALTAMTFFAPKTRPTEGSPLVVNKVPSRSINIGAL